MPFPMRRERKAKGEKFAMNTNNNAVENEKAETSEYRIGLTTYIVTTIFNPEIEETLEDVIKRLIIRESQK